MLLYIRVNQPVILYICVMFVNSKNIKLCNRIWENQYYIVYFPFPFYVFLLFVFYSFLFLFFFVYVLGYVWVWI